MRLIPPTLLAVPFLMLGAAGAWAQATNGGGADGPPRLSFDSKAPIEITSDNLEVEDKQSVATFTGSVRVVQSTMVMTSDTLEVHYKGSGLAGIGADPGQSKSGSGASGIQKIYARGHVFVTSKTDTAQGDEAVYDPDANTVTMIRNVLLTRGQNVLKGTQLVVNVKTGRSVLTGGGDAGRVKGVLVPNQPAAQGGATTGAAPKPTQAATPKAAP